MRLDLMLRMMFVAWFACVPIAAAQEEAAPPETPDVEVETVDADDTDDDVWDIESPGFPVFEQTIDTTEGTWMSLDVSPDGKWIAFDLLGDIYVMPIRGGSPRKVTEGVAWDMQPRFSPDGTRLAFTSDRVGKSGKSGDNIWTIGVDGENPRQITDETFRLLNGPAWHPSGEYIVARKHFTSRRSLGAGEMWMYHVSGVEGGGSGGVQLTEKPTDQKDVNEPVFGPHGKYLYYSEDAWPGDHFEYDKDSNKQIYVINRLEIESGRSERYITGPGGACRPTPSPDGKTIAFVRRFDGKSALHLFDTASGRITRVYDDLERDMQETWAIHGVYPSMAWTPDGESIVFWARGKIRQLELGTGKAWEIPFHIHDTRAVFQPLRQQRAAAPDEFEVKMLRWVSVNPDGSRVAYQALGHIFIKDLPDGAPTRLTKDVTRFEFEPSWSRGGEFLVYTTWNDQKFGDVRMTNVKTGATQVITTEPGHYVEPVFDPRNESIVYRKIGGGLLRSPNWSQETGIYRISLVDAGASPVLITRDGRNPQFGADADVLFVTRSERDKDNDNRKLVAIDLSGEHKGRERDLFISDWATSFRVSPDSRWIAFVERYNVHVAPLVMTGKKIKLGPKTESLPIKAVADDAGSWVHFSGDSSKLHWSLGPTLYTRALSDSFAHLDGAPDELPEPTSEGVAIGFTAKQDKPSGTIALVGGDVLTMNGDEIIEDAVVIITGNRITAVGHESGVKIPEGAYVVDVSDQIIMPGFIDAHAHGPAATAGITPQQNWTDLVRLSFGVTAIHDPSNDTDSIFAASELSKAGLIDAPRLYSTGTILYGAAGAYKAEIDSLDDAMFHLGRMKAVGAFSVKSYNQPRRDQRQQVLAAARELGMLVVPEGGATFQHNLNMIVDGHTGIEHTFPVEIVYEDVLDMWTPAPGWGGVGYTPTLVVAYGGLGGENYWYDLDDVWRNPRIASFVPPHIIEPRARRRTKAPLEDYNHFLEARICKQAIDIGIPVQPGGHGQLQGIDTHWEMWMMVQGGMSAHEALRCGTINAATHLGLDGDLGTVEAGKLADLIVIDPGKNPLSTIRDSEQIQYVISNGRLYDARTMNQLAPDPVARDPMFWEQPGFSVGVTLPYFAGCAGCGAHGLCDSKP